MNSLLTLILSKALGDDNVILSPNGTVRMGKVTTGLTRFMYNSSLCDLVGLKASLTALLHSIC